VITVSILGSGFMGQAHASNYRRLGDRVRVVSVCGRDTERAQKLASDLGAEATTDLDAAIAAADVADVCLPTPLHREITERALDAGKHVFLEKPIALTLDDADAIVDAANRSGRLFMVGLVLRFWPEYVELRRRIASGELGRAYAASAFRLSPPADWNEWMADRSQSGGTPIDLMIHDFDQLNWLLGEPRSVFAREPSPGHVVAVVEYDGASGAVEGSMSMPRSYPFSSNIRVLCENGAAEYAFSAAPAEDGGNIGAVTAARGLRLYPRDGEPQTVDVEPADPWGPEIEYFVECVEQGRRPEQGTAEQARDALKVSLAAARSIGSGRAEAV
jgi:UDP-N-acetylglucosamine 3-dehydrogenase